MVKGALRCGALKGIEPEWQDEDTVVRFENVGLRYGMGSEILRDISFEIEPQSF